jgi:threonine synthase
MTWKGVIEEYREFLPLANDVKAVTLLEGNTPLIRSRHIGPMLGLKGDVYFKFEGMNPTASFKDRGMTVAISQAAWEGANTVICASTGNTAASAAAYAARAGMACVIVLPNGGYALGKLSQALMHGARVVAVEGNFDDALNAVREIAKSYPVALVNSVNPYRLEGQKTAAFEICRQLGGQPPDHLLLPVGNAGNITAYWKGFKEYRERGFIKKRPQMLGFQASGAAPIVRGRPVAKPKTIASAIRIGNPASWCYALEARDESRGLISSVSDRDILRAYKLLSQGEGVLAEPASAASVAGLIQLAKAGYFTGRKTIVCVLTGHGLKDQDTALAMAKQKVVVANADIASVAKAAGLHKE